jgi:hypothetical protein
MPVLALLLGCTPDDPPGPRVDPFPAPDDFASPAGPGAPSRTFSDEELFVPCAALLGDERDHLHHNLAVVHDGWLVHPWAPEDGGGGVSFWDVSEPCAPSLVGQAYAEGMRETHALAFGEAGGREYLAVDYLGDSPSVGGVGFFDITDPAAPTWVSSLATPSFYYPDSYLRVTFSNFWQGDLLFVAAAFNGLHVVDVADPAAPALLSTYDFSPVHLVGHVVVVGNLGIVFSASTPQTVLVDLSDPLDPQPIAGGTFDTTDEDGVRRKYYFASLSGKYGLFARNDRGGGPIVYDLSDPEHPTRVSAAFAEGADGGYVYRNKGHLFQGESNWGTVLDFADPSAPFELQRVTQQGDLDTISPIGNVMVVSVDDDAAPGLASLIVPWAREPDREGPAVELVSPADGAVDRARTSRIGLSFDEWIERASVFEGSFRVADAAGNPIPGVFNVQENVVNFTPDALFEPGERVTVEVPAGGITDVSGNPTTSPFSFSFEVGT